MKPCNILAMLHFVCYAGTLVASQEQDRHATAASAAATATATATRQHVVPTFSLDEIQLGHRLPELSEVLRTTGLFAVKTAPQPSPSQLQAMNGLCRCLQENAPSTPTSASTHRRQLESVLLQDGHTRRTTVATATIGRDPLPLGDDNEAVLEQRCGSDTVHAMEAVRDEVAVVSEAVVQSMDRLLGVGSTYDKLSQVPLLETKYGSIYRTMASIVHAANHLEHFHHYHDQKAANTEQQLPEESSAYKTVEWHTDAGLFLAFLPAHDCQSGGTKQDDSFWIQLASGHQAQAYFEPGSVAVMMGAGAEHWLQQDQSSPILWRATRHAVEMKSSTSRVWYGMMHLVPEDAIIQESPRRTFGDMKQNMKVSSQRQGGAMDGETVAIGCGPSTDAVGQGSNSSLTQDILFNHRPRRRLQHVQDASACNNVTNFFCWTQCLEIPNYPQAESYIKEGNSLYCLDPGILAKSGNLVSKAVEPCIGPAVHNSNCQGIWHKTSPSVEGWPVEYNSTILPQEKYCYGGTSMYMDGFHWIHDTTCVIYLFPSLVLSSQARFLGACFGTILFGMMVEAIIFKRRKSIVSFAPGIMRLVVSAGFYALQLTMGYLVMLIVMTYSMPLFLCCISGLVLGHMVFNARDALWNRGEKSAENEGIQGETDDDIHKNVPQEGGSSCGCNEEKQSTSATSTEDTHQAAPQSCCTSSRKTTEQPARQDRTHGIPEGSTPCCQNSLDVC